MKGNNIDKIIFNKSQLLNTTVSFYRNVKYKQSQVITIDKVLESIQCGFCKSQIEKGRECLLNNDKDGYDNIKKGLPSVTFSATFKEQRKIEFVNIYNNLLSIDIDKIEGNNEFDRIKQCLMDDEYVIAFWVSPSGNGFKGLVPLTFIGCTEKHSNDILHKYYAFAQFDQYLRNHYEISLDESCKDITRLCFLSYDSDLVLKDSCSTFIVNVTDQVPNTTDEQHKESTKVHRNNSSKVFFANWNQLIATFETPKDHHRNRRVLDKIYRFLKKNSKSITFSYSNWLKVALAIARSFHPVYGLSIFLKLSQLDETKYNKINCEKFLFEKYCDVQNSNKFANHKEVKFPSILQLAKGVGWRNDKTKES